MIKERDKDKKFKELALYIGNLACRNLAGYWFGLQSKDHFCFHISKVKETELTTDVQRLRQL